MRCSKCEQEKPETEFAASKKYGKQPWCRSCQKESHKAYYQKNKQHFIDYKESVKRQRQEQLLAYMQEQGCKDCGIKDPLVLEFDHINPETKVESVCKLLQTGRKMEVILAEVAKCEVRCCNCHRKRTIQQFGWYRARID